MKEDFINFVGYRPRQFLNIVERLWNRKLYEELDGIWRLKTSICSDLSKG